uniref:Uncharacterized protein n=1 Tax=Tanacetum cinerariifolium TaxID=118510 RepID=A0A699I532_TANCI|nr:hypothetical protein [Tanacetum cinerariifolium]
MGVLHCPPNVRYVVSSDDSHHSGSYSEATSFVRSHVADALVVTAAVTTIVVAGVAATMGSKARVESKILENVRDSTSTGRVCLGADVRIRAEHTLEKKGELKEGEAVEAIRILGQLTTVEAADAAKDSELKDLKEKNFTLEGEREMLCLRRSTAIGCAINKGIQDGLRARVDHRKAGRDLSMIEAYDHSAKAKYVEAMNALGAVDFSLLFVLKSKKDASIVDLMDSLRLEGL